MSKIAPVHFVLSATLLCCSIETMHASCPPATECRGQWCTDGLPPLDANSKVRAMTACHGKFYIGGQLEAGGIDLNGVARLGKNAQGEDEWQPLARGVFRPGAGGGSGVVYSLECYQNKLYVGGIFGQARNNTADISVGNIARWTGSIWEALAIGSSPGVHEGSESTEAQVLAMAVHGGQLAVGGVFSFCREGYLNAQGDENPLRCVNSIAFFDGTHWSRLGFGLERAHSSAPAVVRALSSGPDGSLYVGGAFESAAASACVDVNGPGSGDDEVFGCPGSEPNCSCQA